MFSWIKNLAKIRYQKIVGVQQRGEVAIVGDMKD